MTPAEIRQALFKLEAMDSVIDRNTEQYIKGFWDWALRRNLAGGFKYAIKGEIMWTLEVRDIGRGELNVWVWRIDQNGYPQTARAIQSRLETLSEDVLRIIAHAKSDRAWDGEKWVRV